MHINSTKLAKFEAPSISESVITTVWIFEEFRGYLWNVAGEQSIALRQVLPYIIQHFSLLGRRPNEREAREARADRAREAREARDNEDAFRVGYTKDLRPKSVRLEF